MGCSIYKGLLVRGISSGGLNAVGLHDSRFGALVLEVAFEVVNSANMFFSEIDIRELVVAWVHSEGTFDQTLLGTSGISSDYLLFKVDVVLDQDLFSYHGLIAS